RHAGAPRASPRPGNARAGQRRGPGLADRLAGSAAGDPDGQHQLFGDQPALEGQRMSSVGNLLAFSPELWLLAGALVVFLLARFMPGTTTTVALVALVGAFLALATQFKQTITILDGAFTLDGFAVVVDVVLLGSAALTLLAS